MKKEGSERPSISQKTNAHRVLHSAQDHIQDDLTRTVPVMESMIQAIFVQIIHAVNHLIVSPCRNLNFSVFASRDTKRMKMVFAKKLLR